MTQSIKWGIIMNFKKLLSVCLKVTVFVLLFVGVLMYFNKCSNTYAALEEAETYALTLAEQEYGEKFLTTALKMDHSGDGVYAVISMINDRETIHISYGISLEDMTVLFTKTTTGISSYT